MGVPRGRTCVDCDMESLALDPQLDCSPSVDCGNWWCKVRPYCELAQNS